MLWSHVMRSNHVAVEMPEELQNIQRSHDGHREEQS